VKDIPLLYVIIPNKLSPDSIYYNVDNRNPDKDMIYQGLKKHTIDVLDLRDNIRHENKDWHSLFYNTDHHWKVETGLWASKIIAKKLNTDFAFNLDTSLLNPQNYNHKTYKSWYLGSAGRKVGHYLAKPDDFTLITTPSFETRFDILSFTKLDDYAIKKENIDFDATFIDLHHVNKKNYYTHSPYGSYLDMCAIIHNKLNSNSKKLFFVGESNTNVIIPFLSVCVEYVIKMDLRKYDASLETIIEKENPDIVIIAYDFIDAKELFDFR
jgi:hypothetical protein